MRFEEFSIIMSMIFCCGFEIRIIDGQYFVSKWGHEIESTFGSDQNETRLFKQVFFVADEQHRLLGHQNRSECDDDTRG